MDRRIDILPTKSLNGEVVFTTISSDVTRPLFLHGQEVLRDFLSSRSFPSFWVKDAIDAASEGKEVTVCDEGVYFVRA